MAPTVVTAYVLLDVFLIVVLARLVGGLMTKIGQPRVVGEILAGVLLGPTLLGHELSLAIAPEPARIVIGFIATLALMLFIFVAGVEWDRSVVRGREVHAGVLAVLALAVPALVALPLAWLTHTPVFVGPGGERFLPYGLFLGAALSVTAFPVMAHILMERGELNSRVGALAVAAAGIISLLMFLQLALASIVASSTGFGALAARLLWVAVFIGGSWLVIRPIVASLLARFWRGGRLAPDGLAIVLGGLILWGLIADRLGVHSMIGAFLWATILPEDRELRAAISASVKSFAMILFLPVFFAHSGFATDLRGLTPALLPATALFLAAAVAGKFLAVLPARALDLSWRETGKLAALFNTRGLLVLVAGLIGLELGIITNATFTILFIVALVTNFMTLPLLNMLSSPRPAEETRSVRAARGAIAEL